MIDVRQADGTDRALRRTALAAAFHSGSPVFFGWRRPLAEGPVEVHAAGEALLGSRSPGRTVLSIPRGASGAAETAPLDGLYREFPCWHGVTARFDGLTDEERSPGEPPSIVECLLEVWRDPFAWFLHAVPVTADRLAAETESVASALRRARARADSSPEQAVEARRLERHLRELKRAATTGFWEVSLQTGGMSGEAAAGIAGLVCSAAGTEGPHVLVPEASGGPFLASTDLMVALTRPPEREIPGVRLGLRPAFDVTREPLDGPGVPLGRVLDGSRSPVDTLEVPLSGLNRHTFVCGATGSGKSQTVRNLLEAAAGQGLPWLAIEPVKAEYRLMANRTDAPVTVVRPGDPALVPAGLNPLEPAHDQEGRRFPLQTHLDLTRALFLAAFQADEPFPQVLTAALHRCYADLGWDLALGEPRGAEPRHPTLADLERTAEEVVHEIGYGREITDNVRGFIRVRLASLRLGTTGRFFEGGHPLDMARLLSGNVVIELEDVGDDQDKAFLMGAVLVRLFEQRRLSGPSTRLRHLTVVEEAHRLLRGGGGPAAHAVETFAGLLAEIRAYGEGLVVAEQIPAKLVPDVIKNTAVKIVHRLPALDDREAVGATMNMSPAQSEFLVVLRPGEAAVFSDGMDHPLLARMPDGTSRESARAPDLASAEALVDPRSPGCGPSCRNSPCALRELAAAQRLLTAEPRIALWSELAVLAHLIGWPQPAPTATLRSELGAQPVRLLDCALSHAVDAAVAARSGAMAARVPPAALSAHVTQALRVAVAGERLCDREEPRWLAPPFRWSLLWTALRRAPDEPGPHPRTSEWARLYSRDIPGATAAEQLSAVEGWYDAERRPSAVRAVVAGHRFAPHIGAHDDAPENPPTRLEAALTDFTGVRWAARYLSGYTGR